MQDLTTGSIPRHLLRTSSFMLVGMIFHTAFVLTDLYWVSRLGTEAIAAVAIGGNLVFVSLAVSQVLGVGTMTLVAHATGASDRHRARLVFNQSLVVAVLIGAVFFALAFALRDAYARSMTTDAVTRRLAAEYLRWLIPGLALQFAATAMSAALRGTGSFTPGTIVLVASVVLNVMLTPILTFGWITGHALGIAGAAISTSAAIALGTAALGGCFVRRGAYLRFVRSHLEPQPAIWKDVLRIGAPAGVEFAGLSIYLFIVYAATRRFGAAAQAGFGIGVRIVQALFVPVAALALAVAPVAAQNFGARHGARVRETFISAATIASATMLLMMMATQLAPAAVFGPFSRDEEVVRVGVEYLRIISWTFLASGIIFVTSSMFQGMGNTVPALFSALARVVAILILLLVLADRPGFALRWIWYLSAVTITLQMAVNLALLRREFRRRLPFDFVARHI